MYTIEQDAITSRHITTPVVRRILASIVEYDNFAGLLDLKDDLGETTVEVDDPTGHYPVTTHQLREIQAEGQQEGGVRFYFQAAPYDPHHRGRQFTLKQHTLGAISVAEARERAE